MSKYSIFILSIFLVICLPLLNIEGRGGRGGGGRGGGGRGGAGAARAGRAGAGVGKSIQRSPSLSRAAPRSPQFSQARQTAQRQQRGNASNLNAQRQAIQNQLRTQQGTRTLSSNNALAQQFRSNRTQQQQLLRQNANSLRSQLNTRYPGYQNWFNSNFFDRYGYHPNYYNARANWWQAARWATVNSWLGAGWVEPIYYDTIHNVYYEDPNYSSDIPVLTGQAAYDQGSYYTTPLNQQDTSWLPLGIFALSRSSEQSSQANMFLQLALNRNGDINGIYYNSSTNEIYEIVGAVDKATQQVIWQISNYPYPIFMTALNNLTDYQTLIRLQFVNGIEQVWTLTQLQQ